jgi:hypothetical protein
MLEIVSIAGRQRSTSGPGDGGDLRIQLCDRAAQRPARSGDRCEGASRVAIEWKDTVREVFPKNCFDGQLQIRSPLSLRHHLQAIEDFSLSDGSGENPGSRLDREPSKDFWRRGGSHYFGNDICIQDDHRSKRGGSRTGSRGRRGSSTPPTAARRRRIDSAKLRVGARRPLRAALKIARASSSMEQPWREARIRRRSLVASSSRRMVILAMLPG